MKQIEINNVKYEIIRNDKDCINKEELSEKITEYFENFDYIVGDYAYDKVRLKGYYEKNNKNSSEFNNIENVENYIENYCSYGSRIFILKKHNKNLK